VSVEGATARIAGKHSTLTLAIREPAGAAFTATGLAEDCLINEREGILTRLAMRLPAGATRFRMQLSIT
jgi:hypothetical protein